MIRAFDSYYGAVLADEAGVVDYSRPAMHRYAKSGVAFSLPGIAEEEDALEAYFHWYTPQPGDLAFDLGAHAGVSTYLLAQAVGPAGKVLAFEPDPITFRHLESNIEAHGLHNVTALPMAIAPRAGRLAFYSEGSLGAALVDVASRPGAGQTVEVDAITLADACDIAGLPAYVKMDIEGAELEVIASSRELLRTAAIHFSVDTNHNVGGSLTSMRLERLFADIGYEATSSADYGFMTTWARPRGTRQHP
jgi:FkbM family methyltransferase